MEQEKLGLSIRYKLLILLTTLPMVSLSLYLAVAIYKFENDKIAYVRDSSSANAKSLATQVKLEVAAYLDRVKPIVEAYDPSRESFSAEAINLFLRQDRLDAMVLYQKSQSSNSYIKLGELTKKNEFSKNFVSKPVEVNIYRDKAVRKSLLIEPWSNDKAGRRIHLVFGNILGNIKDPSHLVLVGLYRTDDLIKTFSEVALYNNFLINRSGNVVLGPQSLEETPLAGEDLSKLFKPILDSRLPAGARNVASVKEEFILGHADTAVGDLMATSLVSKNAALEAVASLLRTSIFFFIALISSTIIISVFASVQLTTKLRELYQATLKIAKGDFDIEVKSKARDEVGGLARSFTWMAGEVKRLMLETAEKARMQSELETVKMVQDNFFPPIEGKFGPLDIVGHFEAASECGGDWWYYSKIGDKIYLWIGDATGHGTPAAMVTGAAKASSAIIEKLPDMSPGKVLEIMNNAIHETSKGKILMTFFLASVDVQTGEMVYANASHDPPYLVHKKESGEKYKKKDLTPLMDVNGSRLGDKKDAKYEETSVTLEPGDMITFYTDGIIDLVNPEGEEWGERVFIRSLLQSLSAGSQTREKVQHLRDLIADYRQDSELIDDITLFMCKYEEAA